MSTGKEEVDTKPIGQFFETLVERAVENVLERRNATFPTVDEETAQAIARINAKPCITIPEAATLLGCSDDHLYTRIREARKGKSKYPIPFHDLDGVLVLPREELLKWAAQPKEKRKSKLKVA